MDSDRKLSKKLNYLPDSSVKIKEIKELKKNLRTYKTKEESTRSKKNINKLFPGISPLPD